MNTFTCQLRVKQNEGALVRVLGLTRRRRYGIVRLTAQASDDGAFLDIRMTVEADRPAPLLARHLARLLDVSQVEVLDADEPGPSKARSATPS